jgi:hypothetical protein
MNNSPKFDVYMQADLETINTLTQDVLISVGFLVSETDAEKMHSAKLSINKAFACIRNARLTSAHWPKEGSALPAYLTADVSTSLLTDLEGMTFVHEIQLCAERALRRPLAPRVPRLESSVASVPRVKHRSEKSAKKKVLAVIDHGCPFAHISFRDSRTNKSLIHAIWDQDQNPDFPSTDGTTPEGFGYGRQVTRDQLSEWIYPSGSVGAVNEDACYGRAGYSALRSRVSHGSVVLGLLVQDRLHGYPESVRQASKHKPSEDYDFVFVQIPRSVPVAPSRGSVERYVLDGMRYIVDCAADGSEVAVVLDYGTEMGPHDGSSWFERALDAMVNQVATERKIKLIPISCSGNSFKAKRVLVVHPEAFQRKKTSPTVARFSWNVPRGNDTQAYLEIWTDAKNEATLTVQPAGSADKIRIDLSEIAVQEHWPKGIPAPLGRQCSVISKRVGNSHQILVIAAPTRFDEALVTATAGSWRIEVYWTAQQKPMKVYAYTHWGGKNIGFPQRTWSPRFCAEPNDLESGLVAIDGKGSTWGSACGKSVVVAGGYKGWPGYDRAQYSNAGVVRGGKITPDYLLVTEELPSLRGILGMGHRSGTRIRANGTSFAAPQLARILMSGAPIPTVELQESKSVFAIDTDENSGIRIRT